MFLVNVKYDECYDTFQYFLIFTESLKVIVKQPDFLERKKST